VLPTNAGRRATRRQGTVPPRSRDIPSAKSTFERRHTVDRAVVVRPGRRHDDSGDGIAFDDADLDEAAGTTGAAVNMKDHLDCGNELTVEGRSVEAAERRECLEPCRYFVR